MFEKISESVDDIQENMESYIDSKADYFKLSFYKKTAKTILIITRIVLIGTLALFVLSFLSTAVAIRIGEAMHSYSGGFFVVAGFYFLLLLVVALFFKKPLERYILKITSKLYFND